MQSLKKSLRKLKCRGLRGYRRSTVALANEQLRDLQNLEDAMTLELPSDRQDLGDATTNRLHDSTLALDKPMVEQAPSSKGNKRPTSILA